MLEKYLCKVINNEDLSFEEANSAMNIVIAGEAEEIQLASLLTAMKMKGESVDEIAGFANSLIQNAEKFDYYPDRIDTCGTGGDGKGTINISTLSAIIAASLDIKVAKHGNRAISGKCGSADVLEAFGIDIGMSPENTKKQIDETNFGFLFAPRYHKAMKNAMNVRKKLNISTIFNILGPLSNPARVDGQVLGVFRSDLVRPMAEVLNKIGVKKALVVHGIDGYDEISISDDTMIAELNNGEIKEYIHRPKSINLESVKGSDILNNSKIALSILGNSEKGAKRKLVLINAAAAIYVANKADSLEEGCEMADEVLNKKLGIDKINQIIKFQRSIK